MKRNLFFLLITITGIIFSSCTQYKNVVYMQDLSTNDSSSSFQNSKPEYVIQTGDILYVKILSINQDITELYNVSSSDNYAWNSEAMLYINGFFVDKEGNVTLPTLGKVKVAGFSLYDARYEVQKVVDESLKGADVILKLANYKITVLGEVKSPGYKVVSKDHLTIFEAIGLAGDVTSLGDTRNIVLLRANSKGTDTYRIDLTKADVLASELYYLMPNDVLYIMPMKAKMFQTNIPSISIVLSFISTTLSLITLTAFLTR